MVRYIGEKVRYYRYGTGWMFGTVADVQPPTAQNKLETATVFFPGSSSMYQSYPTETTTIASFLLERCS